KTIGLDEPQVRRWNSREHLAPPTPSQSQTNPGCRTRILRMTNESDQVKLALFQYQTVRTESDQTRREQQSIITWNQAFAVAFFAVGAVSVGTYHRIDIGRVIFGLVIPIVVTGGALAWAGELIRMERTAVYLRALERSLWLRGDDGSVDTRWFVWENFLWSPPDRLVAAGYRKQGIGYIG